MMMGFGFLGMLLFWGVLLVLLVGGVVLLLRQTPGARSSGEQRLAVRQILDERFARGRSARKSAMQFAPRSAKGSGLPPFATNNCASTDASGYCATLLDWWNERCLLQQDGCGFPLSSRQTIREQRFSRSCGFSPATWREMGLSKYIQMDSESCFSGGYKHPGVIGKAVRLALYVGVQPVFSPFYHPESNGYVERFHQDYSDFVWKEARLEDLSAARSARISPVAFPLLM